MNNNKTHFFDYQTKIYNDTSRYINILKSRQIGITYLLSFKSLTDCLEKNIDVIIISSNQENSNNFINYIDNWLPIVLPIYGETLTNDAISTKKFSNGHRIICLSSNPKTIGGKTGTVIIDEFANIEDQEAVYKEAKPIISTDPKFQFIICSAPKSKNDMFYKICSGISPYNNYSQHKITLEDAIKDGFSKLSIEDAHEGLDDDSYNNLYMTEFIDSGYVYFPLELLESNISDYKIYQKTGDVYIGVDVGKKHDKTSAVITLKEDETIYLKEVEEMTTSTFESRTEFIDSIISIHNPKKVWIDATGIGNDWAEHIENKYRNIVEAKPFSNPFKNEMVEYFKLQLEAHKIQYPKNEDLFKGLGSCKKEVTKSNNITYTFKRDKTGHCDSSMGFMLAVLATKSQIKKQINVDDFAFINF